MESVTDDAPDSGHDLLLLDRGEQPEAVVVVGSPGTFTTLVCGAVMPERGCCCDARARRRRWAGTVKPGERRYELLLRIRHDYLARGQGSAVVAGAGRMWERVRC